MKILITTVQLGSKPIVETELVETVDLIDAVLYDCANAVTREEILSPDPDEEDSITITDDTIVWVDTISGQVTTYTKIGESHPSKELHHGDDYVLVKKAVVSKPHLTLVK